MLYKKIILDNDGIPYEVIRGEHHRVKMEEVEDRAIELQGGLDVLTAKEGRFTGRQFLRWMLALSLVAFIGLVGWGVSLLASGDPDRTVRPSSRVESDGIEEKMLSAEGVARAFVEVTDVEKRMPYVLNPELIEEHLARYPEQARSHPVTGFKAMGHSDLGGRAVSSFAVSFADNSFRLLSVVETADGQKVDWDSYARYCSASWEDLFSGSATEADVRVFVRPGDYHVGQFRDRSHWTCFKLETPDCDRIIYAYARAGSEMSKRMQTYVMKNRSLRQHMTLKIRSAEGSGKDALFVVEELVAMGWVVVDD